MKSFKDFEPNSIFVFFLCAMIPPMVFANPVIGGISLLCASGFYIAMIGKNLRPAGFCFCIPFVSSLINGLFVHNGATVLFFINNNRITKEALFRGFAVGLCIAAIVLWSMCFSKIFTADKLLHVFGSLSPKLALLISMTLRYIPLVREQYKKTKQTQTVLGLYKDGNLIDKLKGSMRIFSILITWALENGIICADSMTARGYGCGKRSRFAIFKREKSDYFLLVFCIFFTVITLTSGLTGNLEYIWFPVIRTPDADLLRSGGCISYFLLCVLPIVIEVKKELIWKSLQSKI